MNLKLRWTVLSSVFAFGMTCAGVAVAGATSDKCRSDSFCGLIYCHHTLCNCCPTYSNGNITWECKAGPCFQSPGPDLPNSGG